MLSKSFASIITIALLTACNQTEAEAPVEPTQSEAPEPAAADPKPAEKPEDTAEGPTPATDLTCGYPARVGDTAKTIMDRFGDHAKFETLAGPEGMEIPGIVLWDGDPKLVVEIGFKDEARTKLDFVRVSEGSSWNIKDLKLGDTLEKVRAANGQPVKFYGFEWDYGGAVSSFEKGKLDKNGQCIIQMTLTYDWDNFDYSDGLAGDVELSSDDEIVNQKAISIVQMGLGYPR